MTGPVSCRPSRLRQRSRTARDHSPELLHPGGQRAGGGDRQFVAVLVVARIKLHPMIAPDHDDRLQPRVQRGAAVMVGGGRRTVRAAPAAGRLGAGVGRRGQRNWRHAVRYVHDRVLIHGVVRAGPRQHTSSGRGTGLQPVPPPLRLARPFTTPPAPVTNKLCRRAGDPGNRRDGSGAIGGGACGPSWQRRPPGQPGDGTAVCRLARGRDCDDRFRGGRPAAPIRRVARANRAGIAREIRWPTGPSLAAGGRVERFNHTGPPC